jgi:hypothetical protein
VGVGACLAWLFPMPRAWRAFAGAALALALPQVLLLAGGSSLRAGSFLGWHVGWDRGAANPLWFWLVNTGLFLPLLAAALAGAAPRPLARFYSPFALLFVVPNLLRLSPWIWDNVKFLFPWYVASTPLVALLLARLSRKGILGLLSATLLFAALTLSGALDLWRVASRQVLLPLFDRDALAFAERVRSATPPGARLAHFPAHDAPALLAGRLSVLGYPGHIWSQGLDAGSREEELRRIYAGAPDAAELLARLRVGFLVLGPQERARYRLDPAWLARFPVVAAAGPYRLLDARATLNARGPATPR